MSSEPGVRHKLSTDPRVISASRRTDIPAFYSDWFMNRIRRGVVAVPNPNNADQISWQSLRPETVEAIVFWTKDARPLLKHLAELDERRYRYYFQYTLNRYPDWLEPHTPHGAEAIDAFLETSDLVGPDRVVWRYDPIFFLPGLDEKWHIEQHAHLAEELDGRTKRCVISFLDVFRKTKGNLGRACADGNLGSYKSFPSDMRAFGDALSGNARRRGMQVTTCAEPDGVVGSLGEGVTRGKCIDEQLLAKIGVSVPDKKDKGQREACGCISSREIGMYDSCQHGCAYCYATVSTDVARENIRKRHDRDSASLLGLISDDDCPAWPEEEAQTSLFG